MFIKVWIVQNGQISVMGYFGTMVKSSTQPYSSQECIFTASYTFFIAESSSLGNTLKSFMKNQSFTEFGVKINITKGSACVMATIYDKSINLFGGGDLQCEKWSTGKSYQIHAACQSKCIKVCMDPPKAAKSGTLKTNFKDQYVPDDKIE